LYDNTPTVTRTRRSHAASRTAVRQTSQLHAGHAGKSGLTMLERHAPGGLNGSRRTVPSAAVNSASMTASNAQHRPAANPNDVGERPA
jgi:hypothetical protein